jgi:hypothetical protein
MPKLPKVSQVLAHLRIGESQRLPKLLGGNGAAVLALEGFELAKVKAEAADGGIWN